MLRSLRAWDDHVDSVYDLEHLRTFLARGRYDWIVGAGFRYIVPEDILERVDSACNVHTSYLPWGRGAHPNVWSIVDDEPAGVTVHEMTAGLDRGPIYAQERVSVSFGDVGRDVHERLEDAAVDLFTRTWPAMRSGSLQPYPQPPGGTYHRSEELRWLAAIDLNDRVTWRHALNVLRALTFPPHENLVVEDHGRQYHVEIRLRDINGEGPQRD